MIQRVLFLQPSNEWYGADKMAYQTVRALTNDGVDVDVWIASDVEYADGALSGQFDSLGIAWELRNMPVLRRSKLRLRGLPTLALECWRFLVALSGLQYDCIVINTSALALCVPLARLATNSVILGHIHERWNDGERILLSLLFQCSHGVIAISHAVQGRLTNRLQLKSNVVYDGVDDPGAPLPLPPMPLRFLFVGRWSRRKGLAEFVRAWEEGRPSGSHLTIVGGFPADGERANVNLSLLSKRDDISVVGEVRDVGPLIDSSHIVITPSIEHEGLGLAAVEGLAHGRPVLATDVDGLSEIVNAQTGWILPSRRPQDWAELIRGIDGAAVAVRTRAARRRYEERFQLSRYDREMVRLITDRH